MSLIGDPLFCGAVLVLWLLPGALQDRRMHRVPHWVTIPLFCLAWPAAAILGTLPLALATFLAFWAVSALHLGIGGADGKVAVVMAAVLPASLVLGLILCEMAFLLFRLRGRRGVHLPGVYVLFLAQLSIMAVAVAVISLCNSGVLTRTAQSSMLQLLMWGRF
jgi:hypothetical protein